MAIRSATSSDDRSTVTEDQTNRQTEEEGEDLLFTNNCDSTILKRNGVWVVSTATPNHMANDLSLFENLDESVKLPFRTANGDVVRSAGKGDFRVSTKNGEKILKNVLYMPGIKKNLLSLPQFSSNGCSVEIGSGGCKVRDASGKLITDVKMVNNHFQVGADDVLAEDPPVQMCSLYRL